MDDRAAEAGGASSAARVQAARASALIRVVPNVLSSMRLALAFAFPLLPAEWRLPAALAGAASDWLDGLVARRYKATSAPGALLDAIADKLFTLSVLVTVVIAHDVPYWQAPLALARDLTVAAIALYALAVGRLDGFRHMRPRLPGKLTTTLLFIWLVSALAHWPMWLQTALFICAALMSAIAAADYFLQFLNRPPELRGRKTRPALQRS